MAIRPPFQSNVPLDLGASVVHGRRRLFSWHETLLGLSACVAIALLFFGSYYR